MGSRVKCPVWCGGCYENKKGRANRKGCKGYRAVTIPTGEGLEAMLKRRDAANLGDAAVEPAKLKGLMAKYPALWEWLSCAVYPDGGSRTLPTLNLFLDAGMLKAFANDRDQGLSACVTSDSLEGLFAALEDGLKADCLEWRVSGAPKKRKK